MPRTPQEEAEFQALGKQLGFFNTPPPQPEGYGVLGFTGRTAANVLPGAFEKIIQPAQALLGMPIRSEIPRIFDTRAPQSTTESIIGGVGQLAEYLPAMIGTEGAGAAGLMEAGLSRGAAKIGGAALGWGLPMAPEGAESATIQGGVGALQTAAQDMGWRGKIAAGVIGGTAGYYEGSKNDTSPGISTTGAVMGGMNLLFPTVIDPIINHILGPNKAAAATGKEAEVTATLPHQPQAQPPPLPVEPPPLPSQPIIGQPVKPGYTQGIPGGWPNQWPKREIGLPIDPTQGANIYGRGNEYDAFAGLQTKSPQVELPIGYANRPPIGPNNPPTSRWVAKRLGFREIGLPIDPTQGENIYGRGNEYDVFANVERQPSLAPLSPLEFAAKAKFDAAQQAPSFPSETPPIKTQIIAAMGAEPHAPLQEGEHVISTAVKRGKKLLVGTDRFAGHEVIGLEHDLTNGELGSTVSEASRGFIVQDSEGKPKFATRSRAGKVAFKAGQTPELIKNLQSEDLRAKPQPIAALQKESEKPILVSARKSGSEIYLSFDATGRIPTAEELKQHLGEGVHVTKYESNIISATKGVVKFRVDAFHPEKLTMSSKQADEIYQRAFGTDKTILGKSKFEQQVPIADRWMVGRAVAGDEKAAKDIQIKLKNPPQPEGPATAKAANEKSEYIVAAAIKSSDGKIWTGTIHPNAYGKMIAANLKYAKEKGIAGFVTNKGKYVTREEAPKYTRQKDLAKGEVIGNSGYPDNKLHAAQYKFGEDADLTANAEKAIALQSVKQQVQIKGRFGPEIANVLRREGDTLHVEIDDPIFGKRQTSVLESDTTPVASLQKEAITRLYRAETNLPESSPTPEWLKGDTEHTAMLEASGRWFSDTRKNAEFYAKTFGDGRISYVDIPTKDLEKYRASNNPDVAKFSAEGRAKEEFFITKELAGQRKKLESKVPFQDVESVKLTGQENIKGTLRSGEEGEMLGMADDREQAREIIRGLKEKDGRSLSLEEAIKHLPAEVGKVISNVIARLQEASGQKIATTFSKDLQGKGASFTGSGRTVLNLEWINRIVKNWDKMPEALQTKALMQIAGTYAHEITHVVQTFGEKSNLLIEGKPLLQTVVQHVDSLSQGQRNYIIEQLQQAKGNTVKSTYPYLAGDIEAIKNQYPGKTLDQAKELAAGEVMAEIGSTELIKRMEVQGLPSGLRAAVDKLKEVLKNIIDWFRSNKEIEGVAALQSLQKISQKMYDHFGGASREELGAAFPASAEWHTPAPESEYAKGILPPTVPPTEPMQVQNTLLLKQQLARIGMRAAVGGTLGGIVGPQVGPNQISTAEGVMLGGIAGIFGPAVAKRLLSGNFPQEIAEAFTKSKGNPIKTFAAIMGHESLRDMGLAARYGWTGEANGVAKFVRFLEVNFNLNKDTLLKAIEEQGRGLGTLTGGLMQDAMDKIRFYQPNASVEDATLQYFTGKLTKEQYMGLMTTPELQTYGNAAVVARQSSTILIQMFATGMSKSVFKNQLIATSETYLARTYEAFKKGKFNMEAFERAKQDTMKILRVSDEHADNIMREYMLETQANHSLFRGRRGNSGQKIDSSLTFRRLATEEEIEAQRVIVGGLEHDPNSAEFKTEKDRLDWMESHKITDNWREWLGEYKNPMERMIYTFQKIHASAISAKIFSLLDQRVNSNGLNFAYTASDLNQARSLLKEGLQKATDEKEVARLQMQLKELSGYGALPQGSAYGLLSGKWVDRFTRDEVNTYATPFKWMEQPILRGISGFNNAIKIGRTAMNPLTVIRNYVQMIFFALISKTTAGDIAEAFREIHKTKGDDYRLMLERHIVGADFVSSELSRGPGYLVSGHLDSDIATKVAKYGMSKILKFYQQPDVLMRAGAFISARRRFAQRAMENGVTDAQGTRTEFATLQDAMKHSDVIDKAVEFTNRYTMNYATVPRIVKIGRQLPFVNLFISYTSEITRILKNLTMDAISPTADSAGRMHAITTLGAMAAIPAMLTARFEGSLSKKDQEDWQKVKDLSPDYSRGRFRLPTSRDSEGRFHYFDITNLLPADSFSQMMKAFSQGDYKAAAAANPILSLQNTPLLNIAAEQISGKDLQTDRKFGGSVDRVREILKETLPPILPPGYEGQRLVSAFSPTAAGGVGLTNQRTGVQYKPSDVIANYMTGMRFGNVELATVQRSVISQAKQDIALQQRLLRDIINTNVSSEQKQQAQENYKKAEEEIMLKLNAKLQKQ